MDPLVPFKSKPINFQYKSASIQLWSKLNHFKPTQISFKQVKSIYLVRVWVYPLKTPLNMAITSLFSQKPLMVNFKPL